MQSEERLAMAFLHSQGIHRLEGMTAQEACDEICSCQLQDLEEKAILRDSVDRLSEAAREVVMLVFDSPADLARHIWDGRSMVWPYLPGAFDKRMSTMTQNNIKYYLRHMGWKHLVIDSAFAEVKKFVKKF